FHEIAAMRDHHLIFAARSIFERHAIALSTQNPPAAKATASAAREGHPERGHLLAVAHQEDVANQHRVVPGFALERFEPRQLCELAGGRSYQRQLALLR